MKTDKEVVQLNGKTFIYYSNKGLVYRHPTRIPWEARTDPQNKETIDILVGKQRAAIAQYQKIYGTNPPRDYIRAILKGEILTGKSLMDSYTDFLTHKQEHIKAGELNPNAMVDLNSLRSVLLGFEDHSKTKFQLSEVNEDFLGMLKEYLLTVKKVNPNTAQKRINSLRGFLKYCKGKNGTTSFSK